MFCFSPIHPKVHKAHPLTMGDPHHLGLCLDSRYVWYGFIPRDSNTYF